MHIRLIGIFVLAAALTSCDNLLPLDVNISATIEGEDANANAVEPATISLRHNAGNLDYWEMESNFIPNDLVLDNVDELVPTHRIENQTIVTLDISNPPGSSIVPFPESYYLFNTSLNVPGPVSDSTISPLYDQFDFHKGKVRMYLGDLIFMRITPQGGDLPLSVSFDNFGPAIFRRPGMIAVARVEQDDIVIGFEDDADGNIGMRSILSQLFLDLLGEVPNLIENESMTLSRTGDAGLFFTPITRPIQPRNRSIGFLFKFTVRARRQILLPIDHLVDLYMIVRYDVIQNPPDNGGLLVGLSPFCFTTFCSEVTSIAAISRREPNCIGPNSLCVSQDDADDVLAIIEDNIEDMTLLEKRGLNESSFMLASAIRSRSNNQIEPLPRTQPTPAVSPYDFIVVPEGTPSSVSQNTFSSRVMPAAGGTPIKAAIVRN